MGIFVRKLPQEWEIILETREHLNFVIAIKNWMF